jgi:ABC-type transport system involved in cytochrome bd biosynthesis fused ATPase/permease subunit
MKTCSLEQALVGVPLFITTLQDALVSSKRIMAHLQNRDQPDYRVKSQQQSVTFKDATISWPSDELDTFKLRLNLEFPAGGLSVVHGKTGCGKTLLLAAILGEARVLSGTLTVPSPSYHPDDEFGSLHDSWIIKHSMAYVAQIPWLEDASVKHNILYGLPFDQSRYDDVLDAAALVKDLEILPDGDNTELGSSGVNLSGGQKWRVSFARALYSRAGILVMDDIFRYAWYCTKRHTILIITVLSMLM